MGHGIVLKGIVKYYGHGKNIPHTFGHTVPTQLLTWQCCYVRPILPLAFRVIVIGGPVLEHGLAARCDGSRARTRSNATGKVIVYKEERDS